MLDRHSKRMMEGAIAGRSVLCLGYPDDTAQDGINWMRAAGAESVDVSDVIVHRGIEFYADLNEPVRWGKAWGLVFNPGTLEHCFNLGQAWRNAWEAVELGGYLMHVFPVSMLNHGFWNLNPIAVEEWCSFNGGTMVDSLLATNGSAAAVTKSAIRVNRSGRGAVPEETVGYALCRREKIVDTRWPVQGAYR